MGGYGSGRRYDGKAVVSSHLCIDVAELKKAGVLMPGAQFDIVFANDFGAITGETDDSAVWFCYAIKQGGITKMNCTVYRCLLQILSLMESVHGFYALITSAAQE
ncbi:hypothetical protein [Alishewanella sp. HL-SH06]|uniref:hypothetical protein n=1 Tax=Alishewanella sp. HL-SH06 TaxID=3461144 RepID=UPI004040F37E